MTSGINADIPHKRKVIIYWLNTWDYERIVKMMNLPRGRTLNGRTVAYVDDADHDKLLEYQDQNILRLVEHG